MRDPEKIIALLKEMDEEEDGRIDVPWFWGDDDDARPRHHHVELLVDAGHAQWLDEFQRGARITTAGYDFLNAVDNQPKAKQRFLDAYRAGNPYAEAVLKAMAAGIGKQILGWITRS